MARKLIKACKELKLGMQQVVAFAEENGWQIEADPNFRIDEELYIELENAAKEGYFDKTRRISSKNVTSDSRVASPNDNIQKKSHNKDMRLSKVGYQLGLSFETIADFLQKKGLPLSKVERDLVLSIEQYEALQELFKDHKTIPGEFDDILQVDDGDLRYVGIVKFYDNYKNYFGYLETNNLQGKITSYRFEESGYLGVTPTEGNLVFFLPARAFHQYRACKVQVINKDTPIEWRNVLRYTGKYADIEGVANGKGILEHVIKITSGKGLFEALIEILSSSNDEIRNRFIYRYLSIPSVLNCVYEELVKGDNIYTNETAQILFNVTYEKVHDNGDYKKCKELVKHNSLLLSNNQIDEELIYDLFAETGDVQFLTHDIETQESILLFTNSIAKQNLNNQESLLKKLIVHPAIVDFTSFISTYLQNDLVCKHYSSYLLDKHDDIITNNLEIKQILLSKLIQKKDFYYAAQIIKKFPSLVKSCQLSDEFLCHLSVQLEKLDFLERLSNKESIKLFLPTSLQQVETEKQYQLLKLIDKDIADEIVLSKFIGTKLCNIWVSDLWKEEKAKMPYLVFDLESDGEKIKEFAFNAEDNFRKYTGEAQLKVLGRRIANLPIVVGHNIRVWDLPRLKEKGFETDAFIWDTLEMEILLNPCRYAYSLHTEHNAQADTELTNKLFWNQLYRLSKDKELCEELKDFLPQETDAIIQALQKPVYAALFEEEAANDIQFFQELISPDSSLIEELQRINAIPDTEPTLLIAPKDLWPRIAQYISIAFPKHDNSTKWLGIDSQLVESNEDLTIFQKCVLRRFIKCSQTPIIANIPQYVRIQKKEEDAEIIKGMAQIDLSILAECANEPQSHIDCIDIDAFDDEQVLQRNYQHIFTIGSEMQDRTHKCQLGEPYSRSKLVSLHSKLPLAMASANYCQVTDAEIVKLGLQLPSASVNVWAERLSDGSIAIYHNYEYQKYRKAFLDHFKISAQNLDWKFANEQIDKERIIFVSSKHKADFDASIYRMTPKTTQRTKYWAYQFALLQQINHEDPEMPIIYIVNDLDEQEALTRYASSLGFYIPEEGSAFRKLEHIYSHPNGLIIVSKDQFINGIGEHRTDKSYCYIWDNMDVDRYKLMWRKLPFEQDINDVDNAEPDERGSGSTAKQCILAEWPIFEHYYSLMSANSRDSKFYILEPSLDEYNDIADLCKCSSMAVLPWGDKEAYMHVIEEASEFFADEHVDEFDIKIEEAMDVIKNAFLDEGKDWYPYQKEILPHILERKEDCIISIPTGGGKSILFQGPAIYRSSYSRKLSLVITPLKALMQDQVEELQNKKGFYNNVDYLSGDRLYAEVQQIYRRIASSEIALLYVTPERFRVRSFIEVLQQRLEMDNGLEYFIFDEAHCISQWGQDFRPDYRNVLKTCMELKQQYPFTLAFFSATITSQVRDDISKIVPDLHRYGQAPEDYNPIREHIGIEFQPCVQEEASRVQGIIEFIQSKQINFAKSRMIIFCRTHKQCEETADAIEDICANSASPLLADCSGHIGYFHAGLDSEQRNDIYEQFKKGGQDGYQILCSTKAFGMGMDIPNIHYVVHYSPPSVMEDYLQEVGRAGRNDEMYKDAFADGHQIPAVCMVSPEDFAKLKDLLMLSLLSWSDLKSARKAAIDFIKRFQSIDKTKSAPIVLPYSFWQKEDAVEVSDTTAAKLALHWLEHIGYFKQGYIGQAYLDITRHSDDDLAIRRNIFSAPQKVNPATEKVWKYLRKQISEIGQPSLVSILHMKNTLRMSTPKIFDAIVECQHLNYLTLNDTMRCSIRPRRYHETNYMIEQNKNIFALHIVMNGVREVLSGCRMNEARTIGPEERKNICEHLLDNVHYDNIKVEKKTKKDKTVEETQYMPWKTSASAPKGAVTKAETFAKNIRTRAGYRIFSILDFIPGVKHQTTKTEDGTCDVITVQKEWRSFVDTFENDCLEWLKYVANHSENPFEWAKALLENSFDASYGKGFSYFDKILTTLKILSYTDNSPVIQTGVEVYTTPKTMEKWDTGEAANSPIKDIREDFDDQQRLKIIRLAAMNIFSVLPHEKQAEYIHRYFLCRNYSEFMALIGDYVPDNSDIISQLKEEVLRKEEAKLENNEEQKAIYRADRTENVNVLAGPGSGKTYVLTLRCAKLIYREAVNPRQILVLAYNRAVVAELRNRLDTLFVKLGMSRVAHQLHVHTFHALAKIVMGNKLDNIPPEEWEERFYQHLRGPRSGFKTMFPGIRYIMVDEFQDITLNRLNTLFRLLEMYPAARLFTIGDINQSIYGFDRVEKPFNGTPERYAQSLSPQPYYDALDERLHPQQMTMFTNYRSYQKILDAAKVFLPAGVNMPVSDSSLMEHEPKEPYVEITDTTQPNATKWFDDIFSLIKWAREENRTGIEHRHISTIAIFFRKNNEVYRGYAQIKKRVDSDIRIRIQGANNSELWREREIFHVLQYLRGRGQQQIIISDDATQNELKKYIVNVMQQHPKWDQEYLDICYTLILNYLDSIRSDENSHTFTEMADEVQDIAGRDDSGQIYKIYDRYKTERLIQDDNISLILTTMHKVKGLEFDAVMITPSTASLPLVAHREFDEGDPAMADDRADIDEERRLLFVAYTRAKKYLHVYKWKREKAIEKYRLFPTFEDSRLGVTEREANLGNYYLSFPALSENFRYNQYIWDSVKKDDEVILKSDQYGNLYIVHDQKYIGRLSSRSSIQQQIKGTGISSLKGFFISDVFVWRLQDSLDYDAKNNTNFTERWCPEARKQGYVVLVQIAGFGK